MLYTNEALFKSLSELDIIEKAKLEEAYKEASERNSSLSEILLNKDLITDLNLGKVVSDLTSYPLITLSGVSIPPEVLQIIPEIVARKQKIISFAQDKDGVKLAMVDPSSKDIADFVGKKVGEKVTVYLATPRDIDQSLGLYKENLQKSFEELIKDKAAEVGKAAKKDLPISQMVDMLLTYAYSNRASDVHIEPEKDQSQVRFRIDGVLHDVLLFQKNIHDQVVSRIKVAAKLKTDEHLAAQDGKMQLTLPEEELDVRVSIVPQTRGEKIVMRLLSSKSRQFALADLGMREGDLNRVRSALGKPFGMILSTGPTGSGKTTSIYAIIKILNTRDVNIATIEDPVEYEMEGVNQIQVNPKTNLTFADGLRSILRQDPNIIFVGEIRDEQTASIAINAATTGHLVLSTLHTNDAATTLPRLLDMGIEPYLAASTVNIIIGQRLVRKVCERCRVSFTIKTDDLTKNIPPEVLKKQIGDKTELRIYKGKGCPVCHNTGYQGRIGIFEVLEITSELRELIMSKANSDTLISKAVSLGMTTMLDDGLLKVQQGTTTIEEVLRATKE